MSENNSRYIKRAKRLVRDKFPEMCGIEPSLSKKRFSSKGKGAGSPSSVDSGRNGHYVLTFERDVCLPGGGSLKRLVRVTMDETGEVVKLTSSK